MTSEITAVRRTLNPIIERICDMWLRMNGYACGYEIVWDDINLHDRIEEARSGLYQAQAENIRENLRGGGERIEPLGGDVISGAEMVPENEKGKGDDLG